MKATEIRDKIFEIDKLLYEVSDLLAKPVEWDGIDPQYLKGKVKGVTNTSNHVYMQLEYMRKEKK